MLSAAAHTFRQKARLAVSLSWVAGYTNAVGFLMLGSVLVSHVTGNVTRVGLAAGVATTGSPAAALRPAAYFGFVAAAFLAGAVASAAMTEAARRRGWAAAYSLPVAAEACLLAALAAGVALHVHGRVDAGRPVHRCWMTGAAAAAMGLQNATVTRISGAVVRTTHLTGVVTDIGIEAVHLAAWASGGRRSARAFPGGRPGRAGRLRRGWRLARRQPSLRRLALLGGIFGSFLFGTAAGSVAFAAVPSLALCVPVAFLCRICLADARRRGGTGRQRG